MTLRTWAYEDPDDEALVAAIERRHGGVTKLELIERNAAFCAALRKAHPDREIRHDVPMAQHAPAAIPKRGVCPSGWASEAHYCVQVRPPR